MSDENKNEQNNPENLPVFRMQKMYLKDLSFENPNAPEVFARNVPNPKVNINLEVRNRKLDEENWEVSLGINVTIANDEEDKTMFIIELEHAGIFLLRNIPDEHMPMVLAVDCPALLFPFTRQVMSQVSVDGGFVPFLMDPVNFMALFENARQQQAEEAKKKADA